LPAPWTEPESIQVIIASWAGLEPHQAFALRQRADQGDLKSLTYLNKTLGESCSITLTGSILPTESSTSSQTQDVEEYVGRFLAELSACTKSVAKAADPMSFIDAFCPLAFCTPGARVMAAVFMSWLCIIDDLTEDGSYEADLDTCYEILSRSPYVRPAVPPDRLCLQAMEAFQNVLRTICFKDIANSAADYHDEEWKSEFWAEVRTCCVALKTEQLLYGRKVQVREWLAHRVITIGSRPLFVLFRQTLGLPCTLSVPLVSTPKLLGQMQTILQAVLGLQNDILGWEKDHKQGHPLNAIEILISHGMPMMDAYQTVTDAHNDLIRILVALRADALNETMRREGSDRGTTYVELLINCGHALAEWMMKCRRYVLE